MLIGRSILSLFLSGILLDFRFLDQVYFCLVLLFYLSLIYCSFILFSRFIYRHSPTPPTSITLSYGPLSLSACMSVLIELQNEPSNIVKYIIHQLYSPNLNIIYLCPVEWIKRTTPRIGSQRLSINLGYQGPR